MAFYVLMRCSDTTHSPTMSVQDGNEYRKLRFQIWIGTYMYNSKFENSTFV